MSFRPERLLVAALLAFSVPALPAAAQEPPAAAPAAAQERPAAPAPAPPPPEAGAAETNTEAVASPEASGEVRESQPPAPNEQGMLQTEELDEDSGEAQRNTSLYALLSELRRAPPGLDGEPIQRPNPLASEPTPEMEPLQPGDAYLFPEGYIE